jgi:hypothetical protein
MAKRRHNKSSRPSPSGSSRTNAVTARPPNVTNRSDGQRRSPAVSRPAPRATRRVSRQVVLGVLAALVVVGLAAGGIYFLTRPGATTTVGATVMPSAQASQQDLFGVPVPDEGRAHVDEGSTINYQHNPPASGPHYPSPKPWGVYTTAVAPGYWVHNLEHGGVVVLYDCPSGCPTVVDQLRQAFQTFPKDKYAEVKLLVTPYSGLPDHAQAMAVAWDYQKPYQTFDLQELLAFYNDHVDHGPEDIP